MVEGAALGLAASPEEGVAPLSYIVSGGLGGIGTAVCLRPPRGPRQPLTNLHLIYHNLTYLLQPFC